MRIGRTLWAIAGAIAGGLLIGVAFSGDELVSSVVWIATTSAILIVVAARSLLSAASLESPTIRPIWASSDEEEPGHLPRGVRATRSL